MKAYRVTHSDFPGMTGVVCGSTRPKATWVVVRSYTEVNWGTEKEAFNGLSIKRAPEYDGIDKIIKNSFVDKGFAAEILILSKEDN